MLGFIHLAALRRATTGSSLDARVIGFREIGPHVEDLSLKPRSFEMLLENDAQMIFDLLGKQWRFHDFNDKSSLMISNLWYF